MADKIRRQALSVQENEELAEVVRKYPCLYDKSRKEYKDKTVVENAWKEVADQLDFIQNGESENHFKLCQLCQKLCQKAKQLLKFEKVWHVKECS